MKISGFSFVRNGIKLYYPLKEAIESILPICDEFVIAVGEGDEDDNSREVVESINSPKIKIFDTVWEEKYWKKGKINAIQTNIAKEACSGDWCFYLQADEVVHEKYLDTIAARCEKFEKDDRIEGLLFDYKHFWGDYHHYFRSHAWYPREIRIVKNHPNIHSWQSAQSFRYAEKFDDPHQEIGTRKLNVALANAEVFHYGWVRPPHLMRTKMKALNTVHWGKDKASQDYEQKAKEFDFGPLSFADEFKDTHPAVMKEMISKFNWADKLQLTGRPDPARELHKHEQFKYRFLDFIEKTFLGGNLIGGFKNYTLLKD